MVGTMVPAPLPKKKGWFNIFTCMILWSSCLLMGLFYLHMQLEAQHQQQEVEQQVVVRGLRGTEFDEQPQHAEVVEVKEPWELVHWEDNSNPPPRDPMEEEVQSEAPDVLPGASELHLHGKLGLRPDGTSRIVPMPLPPGGLTEDDLHESHRGFCFNSRASEAADVDRSQPEVRSSGCRARHPHYPKKLPQASVVMVFHNEHFATLIRAVHSILNHSPPHLLKELVLLDDVSMPDDTRFYKKHWDRLQDELTEYIKTLPKLRLVRLKKRRGLMLARMEGAWRAKGWMVIFLDSHIEASPGWLEPLLARVAEDPTRVVVPSIDSITNDNLVYMKGGGLGVLSFSWTLGQKPLARDESDNPANSPVMCGGLFGGNTEYFLYLGGYDPEMRLYGGEEMEIGFRTWQCGGKIEHIPCSHVGHIFRTSEHWQGQVYKVPGEEITRNKLRAAEVWMDEYKELVKLASSTLPDSMSLEPLQERRMLREKLQCKNFRWFLDNVATDIHPPSLEGLRHSGALRNKDTNGCLDTLGEEQQGAPIGAYPCHGMHGTQALIMDPAGHIRIATSGWDDCVGTHHTDKGAVIVEACHAAEERVKWELDEVTGQMSPSHQQGDVHECLTLLNEQGPKSPLAVKLLPCETPLAQNQIWDWM
mmetsp:Transcript_9886/g.22477  ORF Transcript_9886/g.22477 Transcript_9886/m.22477 type:complete len:645 (-) Transcript_9886:13-1947(-)